MSDLNAQALFRVFEYESTDYWRSLVLRSEVLRDPLGLKLAVEDLFDERDQVHLGAFVNERLIGTATLRPSGTAMVMRQVAIDPSWQGTGIGRQLVAFSEKVARDAGATKMTLHARSAARGFYEKQGYAALGEEFLEVGIPHYEMGKNLPG